MKSLRHLVPMAVALTLAVLVSSCGKDSAPTAPKSLDQAQPSAPTHLAQVLNSTRDAWTLTWTPSTSPSVNAYEVYLYSPDPTRATSYVLTTSTDANTTSYTLPPVTEPTVDYYRVRAVTSTGTYSDWSEVGTMSVQPDPNGGDPESGTGPVPTVLPKTK